MSTEIPLLRLHLLSPWEVEIAERRPTQKGATRFGGTAPPSIKIRLVVVHSRRRPTLVLLHLPGAREDNHHTEHRRMPNRLRVDNSVLLFSRPTRTPNMIATCLRPFERRLVRINDKGACTLLRPWQHSSGRISC